MRTVTVMLFALSCCASAQELTTIEQCRTYRDAWMSSSQDDLKRLPVWELNQRAGQMGDCLLIDKNSFKAGMATDEVNNIMLGKFRYSTLEAMYYRELFSRAVQFIKMHHLSEAFATEKGSN
jgi:hypothetical protein